MMKHLFSLHLELLPQCPMTNAHEAMDGDIADKNGLANLHITSLDHPEERWKAGICYTLFNSGNFQSGLT